MNIERGFKVSAKNLTAERLSESLWDAANILSANRWAQKALHHVEITRSVVESLGFEQLFGDDEVLPIFNETIISFSANKKEVEVDGYINTLPNYHITGTVSQDIEDGEIPPNVIDEIFEEMEGDASPMHTIAGFYDINAADMTRDDLKDFELCRSQELSYEIDHDGEVRDYSLSFVYSIDGERVHETDYNYLTEQFSWIPVRLADGSAPERRPLILPQLSSDKLLGEVNGVDTEFEAYLLEKSVRELIELSSLPKEEHIRRILGMVSMVTSGFKRLR